MKVRSEKDEQDGEHQHEDEDANWEAHHESCSFAVTGICNHIYLSLSCLQLSSHANGQSLFLSVGRQQESSYFKENSKQQML